MKKFDPARAKRNMVYIRALVSFASLYYYFMTGELAIPLIMMGFVTLSWWENKTRPEEKPRKTMKIGLDIHGVCDANPEFFQELTKLFVEQGHEVHILTGRRVRDGAVEEIYELGLEYTHFFSISDYHEEIGTKMKNDKNGNPWMDDETWDRSKGDYCKRNKIDFCIDDTERYGQYFETPFAYINIKKN